MLSLLWGFQAYVLTFEQERLFVEVSHLIKLFFTSHFCYEKLHVSLVTDGELAPMIFAGVHNDCRWFDWDLPDVVHNAGMFDLQRRGEGL